MNDPNDDSELRRLHADLQAPIEKATEAAEAAAKPLKGEALQRYLQADAKVIEIGRYSRKSEPPEGSPNCDKLRKRIPRRGSYPD
jgi:hypothetical protein